MMMMKLMKLMMRKFLTDTATKPIIWNSHQQNALLVQKRIAFSMIKAGCWYGWWLGWVGGLATT
jgi:hypothetical protein